MYDVRNANDETGKYYARCDDSELDADCVVGPVACPGLEPFVTKPRPLWIERWEASEIVPEDKDEARFVPLVETITQERDIRKIKQLVAVWLEVRVQWVSRVSLFRRAPGFATKEAWKMFASGTFSLSRTAKEITVCKNFAGFLEKTTPLALTQASIGGVSFETIQIVIQELANLNFYFDMLEVEQRLTGRGVEEISERMRSITDSSYLIFPGLAGRSTNEEIAGWLMEIRDFIRHWPYDESLWWIFEMPLSKTSLDVDLNALESAISDVYCSCVSRVLHRRPVLPRYS